MSRGLWSRLVAWYEREPVDLDRAGGVGSPARFPVAAPHNSPTPLFEETVMATGVLPWAAGSVEVDGGAS